MPLNSLTTTTTSPKSSSTRTRSVFSRIAAPFGKTTRNICGFEIEPNEPYKSYLPGDTVKGSVLLTVVKPVRITHLIVCLHGYVKVHKNPVPPGDGSGDARHPGPLTGRKGEEYLGNGFASLFEDEVVLCGVGTLKEMVYKFQFELKFPSTPLPSSIDFERGTISYVITATLTRPTTISPTITCDRRVLLQDNFDVATLPPPKPRVITLEPISKRSRVRAKVKSGSLDRVQEVLSPNKPHRSSTDASSIAASSIDNRPPQSPAPSELSSASNVTNSSQSFQIINVDGSTKGASGKNSDTRSTSTSMSEKTITATTELLKAGGMPGDTIPIRINIKHTKCIRSMQGVIVTLYRQGRVDMHPAIPVGTASKGKKAEYEDYYPKSRTGLGGLSLSAGKSSSVYRKDLSQSFAPLVVNPQTMTALVKTSITIPEDAFPTIIHVPGSMISFRYYVEVVIDLRGKLANQDGFLPRFNMTSNPNKYAPNARLRDENGAQITASWEGNILDTDRLRREKSVVDCLFSVTVGSRDSSRPSKKTQEQPPQDASYTDGLYPDGQYEMGAEQDQPHEWAEGQYSEEDYYDCGYDPYYQQDYWYPSQEGDQPHGPVQPDLLLPPEAEEVVDEKTRMRREEALLLPSAPPQDEGAGPSNAEAFPPSAPYLPEEDNLYDYNPSNDGGCPSGTPHSIASAPSVDTIVPASGPSEHQDFSQLPDAALHPEDDKQELERQRLLALASAPPTDGDDGPSGSGMQDLVPSAPVLTEEDEYNHLMNHDHPGGESLPQYRR